MAKVDFKFKSALDEMIGGMGHSACFQCGACVGDCPAAMHSERFNPRQIMLDAVLGLADRLVCEDSLVWECTNCTCCFEHCPQDVRQVEVIMAIKNMIHDRGISPDNVKANVTSITSTGRVIAISELIHKRRRELGLPELTEAPVDELQKIVGGELS